MELIVNFANNLSLCFSEIQTKKAYLMLFITRKFHFSASHRVFNPKLSDEENSKLYGKCANPSGHGHNYILEVTVSGEMDPAIGFVMDLKDLNDIVERELISKVDHRNFNADVDFMNGVNPTTEN